ncbi:MAG: hypothetical protein MR210_01260 [Erysipelotrichaceae bacterium]|nr:hypothetical protein [Erysipelotrichaceae bacterium]
MEFEKRIQMISKNCNGLPLHDISYLTYVLEDILFNNETKANLFLSDYLNNLYFHQFNDPERNIFYNEYKNSKDLEYALDLANKYLSLYNFYNAHKICNSYILYLEKNQAYRTTNTSHYIVKAAAKKLLPYPRLAFLDKDAATIVINQQLDLLYMLHGICAYMLNDHHQAQRSLAKAFFYNPIDFNILIIYLEMMIINNDVDEALLLIKQYLPLAYSSIFVGTLLHLAANCYIQQSNIAAATNCLFLACNYDSQHKKQFKSQIAAINKQKPNKLNKKTLINEINQLGLSLPQKANFKAIIKYGYKCMDNNPSLAKVIFEQLDQLFPHQFTQEINIIMAILESHDPRYIDIEDLDDADFSNNQLLDQLIYFALEHPNPENNLKVLYALGKCHLYLLGTTEPLSEHFDPLLTALEDNSNEISLFTDEEDIDLLISCSNGRYHKQKIMFSQAIQLFENPSYNISQIAINPTMYNEIVVDHDSITIIKDMIAENNHHILS